MPPLRTDLEYTIRRSPRARRVRVTVDNDGAVVVTLPQRASERRAVEAIVELRPWIDRRLRALTRAADELGRTPGTVPYLDEELRLLPQIGRERVHRRGDYLLIPEGDASDALERYYRRQARAEIEPRLDAAVARAGTHYRALTVRNQRTRWGSCSSTRGMSFNWRLLLAPEAVLAYVIEHEVCHLEVMDHSARFWALLESRVPGWREPAAWLRRYGSALVLPDSTRRSAA